MENYAFFPCRTNEVSLLVTSYHKGQMHAWLEHSCSERPIEIHSVPQLLFSLDEFLLREDKVNGYHAFETNGLRNISGIASLRIQILFQENHTWQGVLIWEDQRKEASFRSIWELIQMLDEILAD